MGTHLYNSLFFEGDEYLRVRFVYTSIGELDIDRSLSFSRFVRPMLHEINEKRLVVDSYITYDDYMENTPKEELVI